MVYAPSSYSNGITIYSTGAESYHTLAVFDVLLSSTNSHRVHEQYQQVEVIRASLLRILVKLCLVVETVRSDCAYVAVMASTRPGST